MKMKVEILTCAYDGNFKVFDGFGKMLNEFQCYYDAWSWCKNKGFEIT